MRCALYILGRQSTPSLTVGAAASLIIITAI